VSSAPEVGGGHVMRCISIGRELKKYQSVHFLLCKGGEHWINRIKCYGMTASIYESPIEIKNKKLLVDGYIFNSIEIKEWKDNCQYMVLIDDNNITNNSADLIVSTSMNINLSSNGEQKIIHGSKYALVAPEYAKSVSSYRAIYINNILISCGLMDSNNFSGKALDALANTNFSGNVIIAIGSKAPYLQKLLDSIKEYNFSISVVLDSNGLYDLLMQTDMVIGAGGVSLLERMAIGIPSVTIITAENQERQAKWSGELGATILVDPKKREFKRNLICAIDLLLNSEEKRLEISNKGIGIVDGKGCERVAKCMAFGEC
jgi:spore coat polysaccharide biosynthesis predicted glycosyltransferase SpsG